MDEGTTFVVGLALALITAFAVFVLVIAVEAVAMWRTKWASLLRSSGASALANIVSSVFIGQIPGLNFALYFQVELGFEYLLLRMFLAWIVSALVESPVIWLFNKREGIRTLRVSAIANGASYLLLLVINSGFRLILIYLN